MNPDFVHVFLDKIQRYSSNSDRALFLADDLGSAVQPGRNLGSNPSNERLVSTLFSIFFAGNNNPL
jgi:hypothetical protein